MEITNVEELLDYCETIGEDIPKTAVNWLLKLDAENKNLKTQLRIEGQLKASYRKIIERMQTVLEDF